MIEDTKLTAGDGAASDYFGYAVSLSDSGGTALIGVYLDDDLGSSSGSAWIYHWTETGWTTTKLAAPDGRGGDYFGYAVALSGDGDTAAVGARGDDDNGSGSGSVYVYSWNGTDWETGKLTAFDGAAGDDFGSTLALSDDGGTVLVGARLDDDMAANAGSAYLYTRTGADWSATKFTAADGAAEDRFGSAAALSDDGGTALIGAYLDDDMGRNSGSAYLYRRVETGWSATKLVPEDGAAGDYFGYSVALSGDGNTALVGAYQDDDKGSSAGAAYVYRWIGDDWHVTKLTAPDASPGDYFGWSVSLSDDGNTALIAARLDDDRGSNAGAVYVYEWTGSGWTAAKLRAGDGGAGDDFGQTASLSGDGGTALIGARYDDDRGINAGAAYVLGTDAGGSAVPVRERFTTDEDSPLTDSLLTDDGTDAEEDPTGEGDSGATELTASFALSSDPAKQPTRGSVAVNADGSYTYTPDAAQQALAGGETAQDSFAVLVTDSRGNVTEQIITVTIAGINDAPTVDGDTVATTPGDTPFAGTLIAADAEGQVVGFALAAEAGDPVAAYGSVVVNTDGTYTYTPTESPAYGTVLRDRFTVTATDAQGAMVKQVVHVRITTANELPTIGGDLSNVTDEDSAIAGLLTVSDTDGGPVALALSDAPARQPTRGTVTFDADGSYTYTPNAAQQALAGGEIAIDSFTVTATDSEGAATTRMVTIRIVGINDAPITAAKDIATDEDSAVRGVVTATDSESQQVTFTLGTEAGDARTARGSVTVNADGSYIYIPDAAQQALAGGEAAADSFTVVATDSQGAQTRQIVTVTLTGINDAPVPTPDSETVLTTDEDSAVGGALSATDAEGDAIAFVLSADPTAQPSRGSVIVNADGSFTYTPDAAQQMLADGDSVTDSFTVTASDGRGGLVAQPVTIVIAGRNDRPTAADDTAAAVENGPAVIINASANDDDIDRDDDPTTLSVTSAVAASGAAVGTAGGSLTYDPASVAAFEALAAGETATDTISYTIADRYGAAATATVTVTVAGANDAPEIAAADDGAAVTERPDGAGDENAATHSAWGTVAFTDADRSDAHGLTVTAMGDDYRGAFAAILADPAETGSGAVTWSFAAADAALDDLAEGETLTQIYRLAITDAAGAAAVQSVTVTLTGTNDGPVAKDDAGAVGEDQSVILDVLANDADPDRGDGFRIISAVSESGAAVTIDGAGLTYAADADSFDLLAPGAQTTDRIAYTIQDAAGATDTATVMVTIAGIDDGGTIIGTNRPDRNLVGTAGEDVIRGLNGDDTARGEGGADTLYGDNGDDLLYGGTGIDTLHGDNGDDRLAGGAGDDVLTGGRGDDWLTGGAGHDLFLFGKSSGTDAIADFALGEDLIRMTDGVTIRDMAETDLTGDGIADATVLHLSSSGPVTLLGVTGLSDWDQLVA